jgi:hypothetical protein
LSENLCLLLGYLSCLLFGNNLGLLLSLFSNNLLSLFFLNLLELLCQFCLGLSNGLSFLFLFFINPFLLKLTLFFERFFSSLLSNLFLFKFLLSLFSQSLLMKLFKLFFFISLICSCDSNLLSLGLKPNFSLLIHFSKFLRLLLNLLSLFHDIVTHLLLLLCSCRCWNRSYHWFIWGSVNNLLLYKIGQSSCIGLWDD